MAGRNYVPPNSFIPRQDPHRALIEPPPTHHHRDIQSLLIDNQRLAATYVALKQELAAGQQDLRHLSAVAGNVKAERDAQVREVYERAAKMEADVRLVHELTTELAQVRGDVQKLSSERKELSEKLDKVHGEVAKERSKAHQAAVIKAEIEAIQQEIQRGRVAVEYEKKVHASNLEQSQGMEKNMISMAREIEKLKSELANADKRARAAAIVAAAAAPGTGYASGPGFGNPETGYGGNPYLGPYAGLQVRGTVNPQYGTSAAPHAPYDTRHPNIRR